MPAMRIVNRHLGLWLAAAIVMPAASWAFDDRAIVTVTTTDGKQVVGSITGGTVSVQSSFGVKAVEAPLIRLFSPAGLTLTNGLIFAGAVSILDGQVSVRTDTGVVTVAGRQIHSIQGQGGYVAAAAPAGPSADDLSEDDTRALLLGRWQDSNGATWEFLKDGTVTQGNTALRYSFPDHRHVKLHLGQAGAGMGMHGAVMPMLGGLSLDRVYEIASLSHQRMVFKYQGNVLTLTRMP